MFTGWRLPGGADVLCLSAQLGAVRLHSTAARAVHILDVQKVRKGQDGALVPMHNFCALRV